ncbi:DMT family transporter, partial [Streptomyces scabiei]|uniref:DMT family transporter n=1 Tax=Streptomyces scabiei TaxID=1930 RepID=UPI0029BEE40B
KPGKVPPPNHPVQHPPHGRLQATPRPGHLRRLSPQVAGVVGCLEAVVATVLAWVLLGEHLSAPQILGGAVVLVGAFVAQRSAVGETVSRPPAGAVEEEAEPELSVRP